ncbi:MAG: peptidoglycan-binding protein [Clostridia bacterium]|nr:peptidoglycan-binding protein [Clostridia bacterium]
MPYPDPPVIPEYITVHLGLPDQPAENVRVRFQDYIKNVASSEIYPNWPESAIRANILAQISYALNRVYTEFYRSQGYDFDITNTTQFDQKFILNRDIFENISRIVDDIFNDYVVKQGTIQPYFTQYCNGTTSTCPGLSQWGTVDLAREGLVPYQILQRYYGDDINIVFNAPVAEVGESYPGVPLRFGSVGENVRVIQRELNRIAVNYPAIPRIPATNGVFNRDTEAAVREFQEIFNLTPDGIVGKATWYRIKSIYNGIKRLNELYSEGITPQEADRIYPTVLRQGDTGPLVREVQYLLAVLAYFSDQIPTPPVDGVFDSRTAQSLQAFQRLNGLTPDGIVGPATSARLLERYRATVANIPPNTVPDSSLIYPGRYLLRGRTGDDVRELQTLINEAAARNSTIPRVDVDGNFGAATEQAVRTIQREQGLDVNGIVGSQTWDRIVRLTQGG